MSLITLTHIGYISHMSHVGHSFSSHGMGHYFMRSIVWQAGSRITNYVPFGVLVAVLAICVLVIGFTYFTKKQRY